MRLSIFLALTLAACARAPVELPPPAEALLEPCAGPVVLPAADMSQAAVERAWGADRSALRACGGRHRALAAWAQEVSGGR